jgi:hypothetical protein
MKLKSQSGSILLSTLSFIILLAVASASILELTMNSYKLTMRNELRARARAVAESELENVYFQWVSQIMAAVPASNTPAALSGIATVGDAPDTTVPPYPPFLAAHQAQGWGVYRSIGYNSAYDYYDGIIPNTTKQGKVTYITVRIEVLPPASNYFQNELAVRVGRRFASTNTSIFQYGVFYQGDLEMAPGNDITIDGAVAANGSIYMASSAPGHLTLDKTVSYLSGGYFNQDSDGNTVLRKPNTPIGGALIAPIFGTSQASQVSAMNEPENLLGGIDATEMVAQRPDLFPTENDVYRAAILPPPADTDEYPTADPLQGDDPTINVSRMYTRAGLRITVNTDGTVAFTKPDGTDVTALYSGVIASVNSDFYDLREGKNVKMTTVDMGALMTALQSNYTPGPNDFNGAIYFNVKSSNATTPRAIKLINGQNVTGRAQLGTTVTTNGGLYVQGDYNTTSSPLTADGSSNPAMLMADQITVLSSGWNDNNATATSPLSDRVASGSININAGILTGNTSATATQASGGAQNLVRYLENWNGLNVTVYGSLGRLFESKTFHSYFQQPGVVYGKPAARNFTFDTNLLKHPPAGSPTTTAFSRGSFFVW